MKWTLLLALAVTGRANTSVSTSIVVNGVTVASCQDPVSCSGYIAGAMATAGVNNNGYQSPSGPVLGGGLNLDSASRAAVVSASFVLDGDYTFTGNLLYAWAVDHSSDSFIWSATVSAPRFQGTTDELIALVGFDIPHTTDKPMAWLIQPGQTVHVHLEGSGYMYADSGYETVWMQDPFIPALATAPEPATWALLMIPALWGYRRLNRGSRDDRV